MNELIAQLLAALVALAAAVGSPIDAKKLPDRPAIVQPAPAAPKGLVSTTNSKSSDDANKALDNSSKLNRIEIQGAIVSVKTNGATTTITVGDQSITVDAKTKVQGKLEVGAKVQIEAIKEANGNLVASQVEVKKTDVIVKPSDDKKKTDATIKPSDDKLGKSGTDDSKQDDKSGSSEKSGSDKSGDDKSGSSESDKSGDDKSGSSEKSGKGGGSDDGSGHH